MNKHVVYVPAQHADSAASLAINLAGGVTLSPGHKGYWRGADGKVWADDITLATIFEAGVDTRDAITKFLFDCDEQAVAYETNGVPHLIDAPLES